ncbi:hypothetical protein BDN72DRAFT_835113 [Pluteus cervinus]|uniref:Uncharacterized protein n=1 Tax=Pluteus cervinus TaxID=181527 RepID=A0ACD3B6L1_9AGAR|nr:hypothetical protein BDN72DRAFT_835113 [Pluteus cervinus]
MASIFNRYLPVNVLWQVSRCRAVPRSRWMSIASSETQQAPSTSTPEQPQTTHFKITLRRSAISLGDRIKGTLVSLGIHRRHQTVYHRHTPEVAGKILQVKELVEVENVPEELVKTKQQQRQDRKAPRGYQVIGSKRDRFMNA